MLVRGLLLLLLFWMIARAFWRLMEGVVRGATAPGPPAGARTSRSPVAVKMSPCPGCGTFVVPGKAISLTRGAQTLYFCSEKCRSEYPSR